MSTAAPSTDAAASVATTPITETPTPAASASSSSSTAAPASSSSGKKPIVVLVIGFAGSGKTTLMQRLLTDCQLNNTSTYCLNLDPAVGTLPYQANIDIRDTVNYKQVMKQYNLGPNGGILTSLNLFATRFDQVLGFVDKRSKDLDLVLVDTPGQIEIFTWSASGTIISESLASTYPSMILYVIDTPRTTSPVTFMSNMMYATSIMYKSKLPFLLVFNKTDVTSHEFAMNWMKDLDAFQEALKSDETYMSSLTRSMSLVLDEFYATIRAVGVSAVTGDGMPDLFAAIQECGKEYEEVYRPALEKQKAEIERKAAERKRKQVEKLTKDLSEDSNVQRGEQVLLDGGKMARNQAGKKKAPIIQKRNPENKHVIQHEEEEALNEMEYDEDEDDVDADYQADGAYYDRHEDDAEYRPEEGIGYDEDDVDDVEHEYESREAAEADKRDFDEFMRNIRGNQAAASASSKGVGAIEEGDEQEIEVGKKK